VGKTHESSYNNYPNICSDIEVYRFGGTLQIQSVHSPKIQEQFPNRFLKQFFGILTDVITELRIENLQGFRGQHALKLAPLTLIFGPNGAGKSSLIRALKLLRANVSDMSSSVGNFKLEDKNLIGFKNIVHNHDTSLELGLGVSFRDSLHARTFPSFPGENTYLFDLQFSKGGFKSQLEFSLRDEHGDEIISLPFEQFLEFPEDEAGIKEKLQDFIDNPIWTVSPGPHWRSIHLYCQNLRRLWGMRPSLYFSGETYQQEQEEYFKLPFLPHVIARRDFLGRPPEIMPRDENFWLRMWFSDHQIPKNIEPEQAYLKHLEIVSKINLFPLDITLGLQTILGNIREVGPLRPLDSSLMYGDTLDSEMGLINSTSLSDLEYSRVSDWLFRITNRYSLRRKVNQSLLGNEIIETVVHDDASNTMVRLEDVGVGVSQILPVIEAIERESVINNQLILLEQPELHLHPQAQSEVADLLISKILRSDKKVFSSGEQKIQINLDENDAKMLNDSLSTIYMKHETKQIVAETHSENIILRIQRRIRERLVDADDVSVIYVDSVDGTSRATQIEIGPEGDFIQSWPKSFVDIRLDDLMQ